MASKEGGGKPDPKKLYFPGSNWMRVQGFLVSWRLSVTSIAKDKSPKLVGDNGCFGVWPGYLYKWFDFYEGGISCVGKRQF